MNVYCLFEKYNIVRPPSLISTIEVPTGQQTKTTNYFAQQSPGLRSVIESYNVKHVFHNFCRRGDMPTGEGTFATMADSSREDGIGFDGEFDRMGFVLSAVVRAGESEGRVQHRFSHSRGEQIKCTEHVFVSLPKVTF